MLLLQFSLTRTVTSAAFKAASAASIAATSPLVSIIPNAFNVAMSFPPKMIFLLLT